MPSVTDLKSYLNKEVLIENNRGSKYLGTLVGFRDNCTRFCLAGLVILDKDYNTRCASKSKSSRWFYTCKFSFQLADDCEGLRLAIKESAQRYAKRRVENCIRRIYEEYDKSSEKYGMDNKLHPLLANREKNIFDYFNFFGHTVKHSSRGTGRTTAIALATISDAINNPYTWTYALDHGGPGTSDDALLSMIEIIVEKLGLKHFVFDRNHCRIAFGNPEENA